MLMLGFIILLMLFPRHSSQNSSEVSFKYNQSSGYFLDTNFNETPRNSSGIREAVEYVLSLINGEIISAEKKFKNEIAYWKIDLITEERGGLSFEISGSANSVIKIISSEGPFDYEILPSKEHVKYSEACKTAEASVGMKILKWNYLKVKDKWEYHFWVFTKSGKAEVRVDAETGEVIKKKKK